jgi:hypothetical protein
MITRVTMQVQVSPGIRLRGREPSVVRGAMSREGETCMRRAHLILNMACWILRVLLARADQRRYGEERVPAALSLYVIIWVYVILQGRSECPARRELRNLSARRERAEGLECTGRRDPKQFREQRDRAGWVVRRPLKPETTHIPRRSRRL